MTASARSNSATVFITGGTEGLGRATALTARKRGLSRLCGRPKRAQARRPRYRSARPRLPLATLEMDVTDDASVSSAVSEIEQQAGPVEILINNAGIAIAAPMEEISLDDLHKIFETNYFGLMRVSQRVLPAMRERRRGRIINMSSVAGKISTPISALTAAQTRGGGSERRDAPRVDALRHTRCHHRTGLHTEQHAERGDRTFLELCRARRKESVSIRIRRIPQKLGPGRRIAEIYARRLCARNLTSDSRYAAAPAVSCDEQSVLREMDEAIAFRPCNRPSDREGLRYQARRE